MAAKRSIATEIVRTCKEAHGSRFLKKNGETWVELTMEQSIQKACQVLRDYKRPDREAIRAAKPPNGYRRRRERKVESTPMDAVALSLQPIQAVSESYGVHDHDVLSGRGAFVNGHHGNGLLRRLAQDRKQRFDAGNFTEKQALAAEIVGHVRSLDPPGRFLKKVAKTASGGLSGEWEELSDEKAIHKACQVGLFVWVPCWPRLSNRLFVGVLAGNEGPP